MHKIFLICKREYLTRVKKKSFLVMTLLSPLLMVLFYGFIFYFSANRDLGEDKKTVLVHDETNLFAPFLNDTKTISFQKTFPGNEAANEMLKNESIYAILEIEQKDSAFDYKLISPQQPGLGTVSNLETALLEILKQKKMHEKGISESILSDLNSLDVNISTLKSTGEGTEKSNSGLTTIIGFAGAIMVYFFIFIYGVQVMKGVIEEKTNRIVEVIISSVKPFQLMAGKIAGIAMVGFTQFVIWVALVFILSGPVSGLVMTLTHSSTTAVVLENKGGETAASSDKLSAVAPLLESLSSLNIPFLLAMFLFYFLGGYLFYGALFAAIGSAVDNETDTQQFMMPVTIPLVFSIALAQSAINNPESSLAFWLSVIPFSSPVIMMIRLPFGVPASEIIISMASLLAGIVGTVWLAGRIYRIGILTFGKKPTYSELAKWLFRKN